MSSRSARSFGEPLSDPFTAMIGGQAAEVLDAMAQSGMGVNRFVLDDGWRREGAIQVCRVVLEFKKRVPLTVTLKIGELGTCGGIFLHDDPTVGRKFSLLPERGKDGEPWNWIFRVPLRLSERYCKLYACHLLQMWARGTRWSDGAGQLHLTPWE